MMSMMMMTDKYTKREREISTDWKTLIILLLVRWPEKLFFASRSIFLTKTNKFKYTLPEGE